MVKRIMPDNEDFFSSNPDYAFIRKVYQQMFNEANRDPIFKRFLPEDKPVSLLTRWRNKLSRKVGDLRHGLYIIFKGED